MSRMFEQAMSGFDPLPPLVQKVNERKIQRAFSKFKRSLREELTGDIHIALQLEIPALWTISGRKEIVNGQQVIYAAEKRIKAKQGKPHRAKKKNRRRRK